MKRMLSLAAACLTLLLPCAAQKKEIVVAAAASLTNVLTSLQGEAEKAVGVKILFDFAGSGTLRKQIEEGAPVDVFFSAAVSDMDSLEARGLLAAGTRRDLLANSMVLVGGDGQEKPKDAAALRALLESAVLLAVGNPDAVPAGRYALQALKSLGLYDIVREKLVLGNTVRQVLQYVESGSAPLGIVFATDAASVGTDSPVRILYAFPESALETPVLYPAAVIGASDSRNEADGFIAFLQTGMARAAFRRAGFVVK